MLESRTMQRVFAALIRVAESRMGNFDGETNPEIVTYCIRDAYLCWELVLEKRSKTLPRLP